MSLAAIRPYAWDPQYAAWGVLLVAGAAVLLGHRRLERSTDHPIGWSRREMAAFGGSWVLAALAVTWPLAPLAAHWSLTALVLQRAILVLAVAPLLLIGLPYDLLQWLTRPRAVDSLLLRLHRPVVAIPMVSVLLVGSMLPILVRAQATWVWARGLLDLVAVTAGLVLWMPIVGRLPGIPRLKPVVRFGYLVVQAVVPAFLSFVYIFAAHPIYPEFARAHAAIGVRPLNDQQIAGFVAKLSMLLVLLAVGGVVLSRAPRSEEGFDQDDGPLVWADVERQFERADRAAQRADSQRSGTSAPAARPGGGATPANGDGGPGLTDHSHRNGDAGDGDGSEPG